MTEIAKHRNRVENLSSPKIHFRPIWKTVHRRAQLDLKSCTSIQVSQLHRIICYNLMYKCGKRKLKKKLHHSFRHMTTFCPIITLKNVINKCVLCMFSVACYHCDGQDCKDFSTPNTFSANVTMCTGYCGVSDQKIVQKQKIVIENCGNVFDNQFGKTGTCN